MNTTKEQRQAVYRLCGYNKQYKAQLVFGATLDKEKTSTKDLNFQQANEIIVALGGQACKERPFWAYYDKYNQQHKYILSLIQQSGHKKANIHFGYVADLDWFDNFLHSDSPVKQSLKSMSLDETSKVIFALEQLVKWKNGQRA